MGRCPTLTFRGTVFQLIMFELSPCLFPQPEEDQPDVMLGGKQVVVCGYGEVRRPWCLPFHRLVTNAGVEGDLCCCVEY